MAELDEKLAAMLKQLTETAEMPEGARNALAMLFPKADAVLETYVPSDELDDYGRIKERRISQKDFASVYFRLDPAPASWSRSELGEILELGPQQGLALVEERVQKLPVRDRAHLRRLFLEFLTAFFAERRTFDSEWFYQLMNVAPRYIADRERILVNLIEDDGFMPFNRLLFRALEAQPPDERFEVVAARLESIRDLSVIADFFRSVVGDSNPEGARERQARFFGERTEALRDRLVDLIRALAESGMIWNQISPERVLWFWWGANNEEEVKSLLSQSLNDQSAIRKILGMVVSTVVSSGGNYDRIGSGYEKIVDLDALTAASQRLLEQSSSDDDARLVSRYRDALKRRRESPF